MLLVQERSRPWLGGLIGAALSLGIAAAFVPLHDEVTPAVPAMLLVVPVVLASAIGGRVAGLISVAAAMLALSLNLEPVGSPQVHVTEDLVALVVFGGVAFITNALVTTRIAGLEAVDQQRKALLRSVSHDLRTPLATIRAVSTDLRDGNHYDDETRDELLDLVIDEAARLDRLVANLLSMSRIEAGVLRPQLTSIDVGELVDASVARVRRRSTHWPITVTIAEDLPGVQGDYTQLGQVIDNLLDNAVRHTPPGTAVRVSALGRDDSSVIIDVCDDGPGVSAAVRAGRAVVSEGGGGFGLAICRAIVEQHAGTLHVDDQLGGGTRVRIELPRAS